MNINKTILIVDDEIINIQLMGNFLSPAYNTIFSTNGMDALSKAQEQKPDLILLDIMMPNLDGYQVCVELKSNSITENIPVIFISALGEKKDIIKGFEVGADGYIVKPIEPESIMQNIENILLKTSKNNSKIWGSTDHQITT